MTTDTTTNPLAIGWTDGIAPQPGDFDTQEFDTLKSEVTPNFDSLATRYQTTSRTVRRWHASGADVEDAAAVALHLGGIQHPAPAAFDAAENLLKAELESLNS